MAVFTSSVTNDDDIKNAILADVEMTHPNPLVKEAIWIYQCSIHYLLNNLTHPNRAENAYNLAVQMSYKGT